MSAHTTILTGASRGIGAAIAEIILTSNKTNNLIAVARTAADLNKLVDTYGADRVGIVVGDITQPETATKAINLANEKFGAINSIIFNAGVLSPVAHVAEANVDEWLKLYHINFFSIVEFIKQALPDLRKSKGNIVAVSSGASETPYDAWGAYGSSKAALNHLILTVAAEEPDVSAISIAPGVVRTGMQTDIRENLGKSMTPEALQKFIDLHKNDKLLTPDVPGAVYAYLALKGWSKDIDGKYLRWDDAELKDYQKEAN